MTRERTQELFGQPEEQQETAARLTAALLTRLAVPPDPDQAAEFAVSLLRRVGRRLASGSPEGARPEEPDLHVRQKEQP